MNERLTAFGGKVEFTRYTDDGAVASKRLVDIGALEAQIPPNVMEFLKALCERGN